MIRNVVIHIANEQPLLTDLFGIPAPTDVGLLCTNLRLMDGKRPVFIDNIKNTFFFPYHLIRFLEIPVGAVDRHEAEGGSGIPTSATAPDGNVDGEPASRLPAVIEVDGGEQELAPDLESDLGEIDEDFLRRIRDI